MSNDPGLALDARVALEVMGDEQGDFGTNSDGRRKFTWRHGNSVSERPPYYSSDIAAAWEVHLNVLNRVFSLRKAYHEALQQQASQQVGFSVAWPDVLTVLRHAMPKAICIAAISAVGR